MYISGLSAAGMLLSSVQGRIYRVSRDIHAIPATS